MAPHYRPLEQPRASMNFPQCIPFDASVDHQVSTAGAAATVALPADALGPNCIRQIFASYSITPGAGMNLQIKDGASTVIWEQSVQGAGPFSFTFDPPKTGTKNTAMNIVLSADVPNSAIAYLDVNAYVQT